MWNNLQGCRKHIVLRELQVQLSLKLIRNIMFYMIGFFFNTLIGGILLGPIFNQCSACLSSVQHMLQFTSVS